MKFEEIDYEGVVESNKKIYLFLARKYSNSIAGFDFEDLVHEQKIACYHALSKIDNRQSIGAYFYTVAENRLKTIYRYESRKKRKPELLLYLENGSYEHVGLLLKSPDASPEEGYYVSEIRRNAAIVAKDILSDFEYKLYVAVVEESKSNQQIAIAMGKSESQVNNGVSRMRKKMREKRELIY